MGGIREEKDPPNIWHGTRCAGDVIDPAIRFMRIMVLVEYLFVIVGDLARMASIHILVSLRIWARVHRRIIRLIGLIAMGIMSRAIVGGL